MYNILLVMFFAIDLVLSYMDSNMSAKYGIIEIKEGLTCNVTINGHTFEYNGTIPGYNFGLIRYQCNDELGSFISKAECVNCGLYCPINDIIVGCQHFWTPTIIGILIGCLTFVLFTLFTVYMSLKIYNSAMKARNVRKVAKRERRMEKIEMHLRNKGIVSEPYESCGVPTANMATETTNNRVRNIQEMPLPNAPQLNQEDYVPIIPGHVRNSPFLALAMLLLFPLCVIACDQTLVLRSDGKICDSMGKCQVINTYTFQFDNKKTVCFKTGDGGLATFNMIESRLIERFSLMYLTSDFDIKVNSTSQCKRADQCYNDYCYKGAKFPKFADISNQIAHDYDCTDDNLSCDTYCYHGSSCVWYSWQLALTGNKYQVFKKSITYWRFGLQVSINNISRIYQFDTSSPSRDISIPQLYDVDKLPIFIYGVDYPKYDTDNYVIKMEDKYYNVEASPLNFPKTNTVGDLQISLDNGQQKYEIDQVKCKSTGCVVKCIAPEPSIRTLKKTKQPRRLSENFKVDNYNMEMRTPIIINAMVMLGNVEFKSLYLEQAECVVNHLYTYGCTGCNVDPYIIFQSTNIKSPGVIAFESNCSLDSYLFQCSPDLYPIRLMKNAEICRFYIERQNITFHINIKYQFVGDLSQYSLLSSQGDTFKDLATSLLSNDNFINAVTMTFLVHGLLVAAVTLGFKIINRALLVGFANKVEEKA